MKDREVVIILFLIFLNFLLLIGNWQSTDNGFFIRDSTAGSMRYNYEESWDWNPNPMSWLGSILGMVAINFAIVFYLISKLFIKEKHQ